MSEIAKCRCGIRDTGVDSDYDGWAVTCNDCGCRGPFVPTYEEAISAWNALMRPRPVAEWKAFVLGSDRGKLASGSLTLGEVSGDGNHWVARCYLTDETRECANPWAARAWLEERVKAAGFDVEDVSDG